MPLSLNSLNIHQNVQLTLKTSTNEDVEGFQETLNALSSLNSMRCLRFGQ